jgi:hypothetical protein
MRDLRDLSKLPADPGYWEELEARITGLQGGKVAGLQGDSRSGWWTPLANRALGLGGLAAAAGISALLLVPPRTRNAATNPAVLFRLPDDPAMVAFLTSPEPPSLGALMASLLQSTP